MRETRDGPHEFVVNIVRGGLRAEMSCGPQMSQRTHDYYHIEITDDQDANGFECMLIISPSMYYG